MLERALAMSMEGGEKAPAAARTAPDFGNMTEDEQIAFAMQMSMQDTRKYFKNFCHHSRGVAKHVQSVSTRGPVTHKCILNSGAHGTRFKLPLCILVIMILIEKCLAEETPMEVEDSGAAGGASEDYAEVMSDPEFLQSVLENLPGVDPQSEAVRQAVDTLSKEKKKPPTDKDQSKK
jgi:26S proteasome regulatory subunit N10